MNAVKSLLLVLALAANAAALDFSQSVCKITQKTGRNEAGSGSGCVFVFNADECLILTAAHVMDDAEACYVEFTPGGKTGYHYPGEVIATDKGIDWAIISVDAAKFVGWQPTPIRPLNTGEVIAGNAKVYFAGFGSYQISRRESKRLPLQVGETKLTLRPYINRLETATPFMQGESGGPCISISNGKPRIIGIISQSDNQNGYVVPIDAVKTRYREAVKNMAVWNCQYGGSCGPGGCPQPQQQPRYQPLRPGQQRQQPSGQPQDRLPSWIVPEVPDATPAPSRGGALAPPIVDPVPEIGEVVPVGPETPVPGMDGDTYQDIIERANTAWQSELRKRLEVEAELKSTAKALEDAGEAAQEKIEAEQAKAAEALKSAKEAAENVEATAAAQIEAMSRELEQLRQQAEEHAAPVVEMEPTIEPGPSGDLPAKQDAEPVANNPPAELTIWQRAYRDISWLLVAAGAVSWVTWFIAKRKGGA